MNGEGANALSLQTLARTLKVKPPSLYNHIGGLPELQRELARVNAANMAATFADAAIGKSGAAAVRSVASAYREYIHANPGLYTGSLRASGNAAIPDTELEAIEDRVVRIVLTILEPYGLADEAALHAVRGLRSLVHGFAGLEIAGGFGLPLDCDHSFARLLDVFVDGLENGRFREP